MCDISDGHLTEGHAGLIAIVSNRCSHARLEFILYETANWTVYHALAVVLREAASLWIVVREAAEFAASRREVVATVQLTNGRAEQEDDPIPFHAGKALRTFRPFHSAGAGPRGPSIGPRTLQARSGRRTNCRSALRWAARNTRPKMAAIDTDRACVVDQGGITERIRGSPAGTQDNAPSSGPKSRTRPCRKIAHAHPSRTPQVV